MTFRFQRGSFFNRSNSTKSHRPSGISRRMRKRQLGFETLEDRRVMSADSPLASLRGSVASDVQLQVQSYSSATAAGLQQQLLDELYWQSLQNGDTSASLQTLSIPTDPLLNNQWHLINTGQSVGNPDFQPIFGVPGEDINVAPVWNQGITGNGVTVAVIDSGVEDTHPDLLANISPTLQLDPISDDFDATPRLDGVDQNGNAIVRGNAHGTEVAGLIGAVADNGIGGTGVAPGATIVPIRLIDPGAAFVNGVEQATIDAFRYATSQIDITNNSWGPAGARQLGGPTPDELLALRDSVFFGRPDPTTGEALGVVHVFASGNSAGANFDQGFPNGIFDTAAYNGYVGSRYTIGVTGVDHDGFFDNADGTFTDYPETSTAVFVAAPTASFFQDIGDDTGLGSGIVTTDITGEGGGNFAPDPVTGQEFDRDFLADTDYVSRFNGTSAAAPLVSGVIALMLEANPHLSWRDVQDILVRSARQNAEFGVPSTVGLGSTQNTWIVNQMPLFHSPDTFDPLIDPDVQTLTPTLDLTLGRQGNAAHFQPTPQVLTNGAGFTVSQGVGPGGQNLGFAHGVIDAELAVQLAQQWQTKNQALPDELTFTTSVFPTEGPDLNIPAMERGNDASGNQLVPGGIGGSIPGGFINYWNEYYAAVPDFSQDFEDRGGFIELSVPDNNTMTVESVEVKLSISGANAQFMDRARVLLVSPNGTHSELNQFWVDTDPTEPASLQNISFATIAGEPGSVDPDTGNFVWTFTTNRNWGERSDDAIIFDPTTMEPASGVPIGQGWQLHIENYDQNDSFGLAGAEVVWHGSPIGANTQRVQGLIGVDDNRDDLFNYSRVNQVNFDTDGVLRFGEVVNVIDQTHESMGANVTVTARRASDGVVVDQFVTGADGNYYFDLVPDDYIISIEDPLGRAAVDDTLTPAGFLQNYKDEWTISADFFKAWDYDANLEVPVQADGTPFAFLDAGGDEVPDGVKHLNFLLDPGDPPAAQVDFSGVVFADINGDGIFNSGDVNVPGVSVFGDVNRNGQFDTGEVIVATNISGEYSLTVPLDPSLSSTVVNVGVITPVDWSFSDPSDGIRPYLVNLGDSISTNTDFAITPPVGQSPGNSTSQDGYLLGVVFIDPSGDGIQQATEPGQAGIDVFIDSNGSGSFEAGERITSTNVNGAYVFEGVAPGTQVVRIETDGTPFIQTFPLAGGPQLVNLNGGGTVSNILFGLFGDSGSGTTTATLDFGDLPAEYGITLLAEDGARHPEGVYYLGSTSEDVDAENTGLPSPDARGDNNDNLDDENGIVVDELVEGALGHLVATASIFGGYLQGWVDFNGDYDFDDAGERIITNKLLVPGPNDVYFDIPATLTTGDVFARFRYGEFGIDSVTGLALIGEVEDYKLEKVAPAITVLHGPDFNEDGNVNGFDFLSWQRGYGKSGASVSASDGDSNSDSVVDGADYIDWSAEFGGGSVAASAPATGDYDDDGDTDGSDFLTWQAGFGSVSASLALGDGNNSSSVDAEDLSIWSNNFGQTSSGASLAATASGPSESNSAPILAAAQAPLYANATPNVLVSQSTARTTLSPLASVTIATAAPVETTDTPVKADGLRQHGARQVALASLASQTNSAEDHALTRFVRHEVRSRIENRSQEIRLDRSVSVEELGHALQGRVLDRLFARRQRPSDINLEHSHRNEEVAEEALSVALGEETDWRFF